MVVNYRMKFISKALCATSKYYEVITMEYFVECINYNTFLQMKRTIHPTLEKNKKIPNIILHGD